MGKPAATDAGSDQSGHGAVSGCGAVGTSTVAMLAEALTVPRDR